MKKYLFLVTLFILSSCGWTSSSSWLIEYSNDDFSLQIPATWNILDSKSTLIPEPKEWKVALAVTSPEVVDGFSNNLIILKKELSYSTNSKQFSKLNNTSISSDYFSYKEVENKDISFSDWEDTSEFIFEAQYSPSTPKLRFLQLGRVCGTNISFFLTIGLSPNITDTARYEEILKSFECK